MPSRHRRIRATLIERLALAEGLAETVAAADRVLREGVGADGSAWGTVDPATTLSTSCARFGRLDDDEAGGRTEADRERRLFQLEWADDGPNTFWDLARRGRPAAALRDTVGDPSGVRRFAELLDPAGIHDELRVRLATDGLPWGTAILYRTAQQPFGAEEVALAAEVAPVVARALRAALLRAVCDSPDVDFPPGTVVLGPDDDVVLTSPAAEQLLSQLGERQAATVLRNLAAVTRTRGEASLTVTAPGTVVALHGSPAKGIDGAVAAVVERPRPIELAPLIIRAAGLTVREREVAEAVLSGAARGQIARRLRIGEQTVADHLQSVYRKTGVAGRAELAALLFGRFYEQPRARGVPPGPYGYFVT